MPLPPPPPPKPAFDIKNLKCSACGAPLHLDGPIQVATCEYCGATTMLSGDGWKNLQAHTMLIPQVMDQNAAMASCRHAVDKGFMHRHDFEEAKLVEAKGQFVPYWIVPATAITHYQYQDMAAEGAQIGGTIAASALLGAALGGRGFIAMPMGGNNATRAAELSGQYQFPVIGVKGLQSYQPRDYQFELTARVPYDKKKVPPGLQLLNGDVGADEAKFMANNMVQQAQQARAHAQHKAISQINTQVNISGEPELLHVPVWYLNYAMRKGGNTMLVVDAARNQLMNLQGPAHH